jgi:hypothetical protein
VRGKETRGEFSKVGHFLVQRSRIQKVVKRLIEFFRVKQKRGIGDDGGGELAGLEKGRKSA